MVADLRGPDLMNSPPGGMMAHMNQGSNLRESEPEKEDQDSSVEAEVLSLLESSYKEVLDAVKHQDDKIGRLFAGISFLTAASLAMANLGGSAYLSQRYEEW